MSSISDRQSPTVPINNFTCDHCEIPKSVFKSNIEEEKYDDEIKKFCSKECKFSYALKREDELNRRLRADELNRRRRADYNDGYGRILSSL